VKAEAGPGSGAVSAEGGDEKPTGGGRATDGRVADLASEVDEIQSEALAVLKEILSVPAEQDRGQILEDAEIRRRLDAHMGGAGAGFLVLVGTAILVATVMRVSWFASRPFVGFGILGGLLVLRGLRQWYRAADVRYRMKLHEARADIAAEAAARALHEDSRRQRRRPRQRR
jgi:hypothetical protein